MIEGSRLLPWFQEAARRDILGPLSDCTKCKAARTKEQRQLLGCGFELPPAANKQRYVMPWSGLGYDGPKPTSCPGYTTGLPEVLEIARARFHWSKGGLTSIGITEIDHPISTGIEIVECAANDCQEWRTTPRSKGGGAD